MSSKSVRLSGCLSVQLLGGDYNLGFWHHNVLSMSKLCFRVVFFIEMLLFFPRLSVIELIVLFSPVGGMENLFRLDLFGSFLNQIVRRVRSISDGKLEGGRTEVILTHLINLWIHLHLVCLSGGGRGCSSLHPRLKMYLLHARSHCKEIWFLSRQLIIL